MNRVVLTSTSISTPPALIDTDNCIRRIGSLLDDKSSTPPPRDALPCRKDCYPFTPNDSPGRRLVSESNSQMCFSRNASNSSFFPSHHIEISIRNHHRNVLELNSINRGRCWEASQLSYKNLDFIICQLNLSDALRLRVLNCSFIPCVGKSGFSPSLFYLFSLASGPSLPDILLVPTAETEKSRMVCILVSQCKSGKRVVLHRRCIAHRHVGVPPML